jgi:Uma2 family endonuclease
MTQAKLRFTTFEEYLAYSSNVEGRFQLIDGGLTELPPESELNNFIANHLQFLLVIAKVAPLRLIRIHTLELQVPVLNRKDPMNCFPDLAVLREEHILLTERRLTITRDMPPPRLIAEVVSPSQTNRDRDYINKRAQYAAIGVGEYWLIDPSTQMIVVLELRGDTYGEVGAFRGSERILSPTFPELALTAEQVFQAER